MSIPLPHTTPSPDTNTMSNNHHAHVITKEGNIRYLGYVSMQRGCPATRKFAESSGRHVTDKGVSFVVGNDATPEAITKAIEILKSFIA